MERLITSTDLTVLLFRRHARLKNGGLDFPQIDCRLKIVDEGVLALNPAVGQLANLLGVKALPSLAVEVLVQCHHENGVTHVYKRVAHVAVVLQVDGQVKKVVAAEVLLIDAL